MDRPGPGFQLRWLLLPASWVLLASGLSLHEIAYTGVSAHGDRVASVDPGSPGGTSCRRSCTTEYTGSRSGGSFNHVGPNKEVRREHPDR